MTRTSDRTVLFADLRGSTALYESLGRDTRATIAAFRQVLGTGPHSESELIQAAEALPRQTSSTGVGLPQFRDP